jgi:catechol 2,3-dioxygenase-like lactoylglutathione lyase family enzyme
MTSIDNATERGTGTLRGVSPCFIVKSLRESVGFYVDRLGFRLDYEGPEGGPFFAMVTRDNVTFMLKAVANDVPPIPNRSRHRWAPSDAWIYSTNVDAVHEEFRQRGVVFETDPSWIEDGIWGFKVNDADGYLLVFGEARDRDPA